VCYTNVQVFLFLYLPINPSNSNRLCNLSFVWGYVSYSALSSMAKTKSPRIGKFVCPAQGRQERLGMSAPIRQETMPRWLGCPNLKRSVFYYLIILLFYPFFLFILPQKRYFAGSRSAVEDLVLASRCDVYVSLFTKT
jgi:hypothetical protein